MIFQCFQLFSVIAFNIYHFLIVHDNSISNASSPPLLLILNSFFYSGKPLPPYFVLLVAPLIPIYSLYFSALRSHLLLLLPLTLSSFHSSLSSLLTPSYSSSYLLTPILPLFLSKSSVYCDSQKINHYLRSLASSAFSVSRKSCYCKVSAIQG